MNIDCFATSQKTGRANPLIDIQTAIDLIGATKTTTGLKVICLRDDKKYELGLKVSDDDFGSISIDKIPPLETWNYKIILT